MRIGNGVLRSAVFAGVAAALLALASMLLVLTFTFGFAASETMVNPNARPDANTDLKRAANLAFSLFAAVQVALALVAVKSGVLKTRLHWVLRAGIALVAGVIMSYLAFDGIARLGGLPRPVGDLVGALGNWIQHQSQR